MKFALSILACLAALPAAADPPAPAAARASSTIATPPPTGTAAPTPAPPAATADGGLQLQLNLHALRVAAEQDALAADIATRTASSPVAMPISDPGSIATMRGQMNNAMTQLTNKCIGVSVVNKGGNSTLICGDSINSPQSQSINSVAPLLSPTVPATTPPAALPPAVPSSAPVALAPQ